MTAIPVAMLHCHTTVSDGLLSPYALWQAALRAGYRALAITDHNSVAGYDALRCDRAALAEQGCALYGGVELTVRDPSLDLKGHLTVLFPDHALPAMKNLLTLAQHGPVDLAQVATCPDFLILSGCRGSILYRAMHREKEVARRNWLLIDILMKWQHLFGDRLAYEIMPDTYIPQLSECVGPIMRIPTVATGDVHGTRENPLMPRDAFIKVHAQPCWRQAVAATTDITRRLDIFERREASPHAQRQNQRRRLVS